MIMKTYHVALSLYLLLLPAIVGCNKIAGWNEKRQDENCSPSVACTDQYVIVGIAINDSVGDPYILDSFFTTRTSTGEVIRYTNTGAHIYSVLEDDYRKKLQHTSDEFVFTGYKSGRKAINEKYVIGADCCHIIYKSGKKNVIAGDDTGCPAEVICTAVYAMVQTTIHDARGNALVLDSFYTIRQGTGEVIRYPKHGPGPETYSVLEDNYRPKLQNTVATFILKGFRNGQQVVSEPYVISADCCHIAYVSGNKAIVLP